MQLLLESADCGGGSPGGGSLLHCPWNNVAMGLNYPCGMLSLLLWKSTEEVWSWAKRWMKRAWK